VRGPFLGFQGALLGMRVASMFSFCSAALAWMLSQPALPRHKLTVRDGEGGVGRKEGLEWRDEDVGVCLISGMG